MIDPHDETLRALATDIELSYLDAIIKHGSQAKAAKAVGRNTRTISRAMSWLKKRAEHKGYSPKHQMTRPTLDHLMLTGHSDLEKFTDDRGEVQLRWNKYGLDKAKLDETLQNMIQALSEEIPRTKPVTPPKHCNADLLNCYVITDYHLGALAWAEETKGDAWDIKIAEELLFNWFAAAIKAAPDAEAAILAQLGDFLHWDGLDAVTPTNKHVLDADTRFAKLVRVAIRVVRRVIEMLLKKHKTVHVLMAEGNHDIASSVWLREWLVALYEDEPRVTVDNSPDPYYGYEHGKTSIFFHHGHKKKFESLDGVFASKFREVFGRTLFSYVHTGHLHHQVVKETSMMILEQHPTLAAPDSHASRGGYGSRRAAKVITYHKLYGDVARLSITPEMVKGAA